MQVERLLKIIFLLMNGTCRTAKELAQSCTVSVRTIQRDIDALSLAGIPVFSHGSVLRKGLRKVNSLIYFIYTMFSRS